MNLFRKIHAFLIPALLCAFSGFGCGNSGIGVYYTLTVSAENGTVAVDPVRTRFRKGTYAYITATPSPGYDFYTWEGDETGKENPARIYMDSDKSIIARFVTWTETTYYVDYDGGSDGNSGLAADAAWKHAPGDVNATGNAAAAQIGPGCTLLFRGGVAYRGQIDVPADGAFVHRVVYRGDAWPGPGGERAIIDGGDPVTGWTQCQSAGECGGNEHYANIYYAYIPADSEALSVNLHEYDSSAGEDEFLWTSQDPDPADWYFYDERDGFMTVSQADLTLATLTDDEYFTQDEGYWAGSSLLIWVNPNIVVLREITGYDPDLHRVSFDALHEQAIYPDGRDQAYAIYNSVHAIDGPGEYCISTTPDIDNNYRILLWPRSAASLDARITRSVRSYGFDMNTRSNITIEGFVIRKHCGTGLRDGVGIGTISAAHLPSANISVLDNVIVHNRKGGSDTGYGGVFMSNVSSLVVEGNESSHNPRNSGIFVTGGRNHIIRDNSVVRSGSTSIRLYGTERTLIVGNTVLESRGSHANGITVYIGSKDVLVAGNRVLDSASPITFQDSGNLWFVNNLVDAFGMESNVNEWGVTSRGPWAYGTIAFINNTLVCNSRNAALNFGDVPARNDYISVNNIIDGGGNADCIYRRNNLYTGLSWSQDDYYGWELAAGELLETDMALVFSEPAARDYRLRVGSPAVNAGRDVLDLLPVDLFPEYDFTADIDGNPRGVWDIGAYAYGE